MRKSVFVEILYGVKNEQTKEIVPFELVDNNGTVAIFENTDKEIMLLANSSTKGEEMEVIATISTEGNRISFMSSDRI